MKTLIRLALGVSALATTALIGGTPTAGALRPHVVAAPPPLTGANVEVLYGTGSNTPNASQSYPTLAIAGTNQSLNLTWSGPAGSGQFTLSVPGGIFPGNVYSTDQGAVMGVTERGITCGGGITAAEVDQLVFAGDGSVLTAGIQFDCLQNQAAQEIIGTFAFHMAPSTPGQGYYIYGNDGSLASFGNDSYLSYLGDLSFSTLNKPVVGMATRPNGGGYWMVASDGGIFAYGDAQFWGSTGALVLNQPIVGMATTPTGRGYWLVASDGGIFAYGDAQFYGSTGALHLNKPIVGMAATPSGLGYWLVASDGGIFAYGDAQFYGSTGALHLNKPIVGMASTPSGLGYWFVASDGGIFTYGDAPFAGSLGAAQVTNVAGIAR
jgi:hypothetical protein